MTPMLKQYHSVKDHYPDAILFFRLGDFYEMFFEDAKKASQILDITLTSREGGKGNRIPMCGIPYHAARGYINRLNREGLKVAICEQVEDPKASKGIVSKNEIRNSNFVMVRFVWLRYRFLVLPAVFQRKQSKCSPVCQEMVELIRRCTYRLSCSSIF